MRAVGMRLPGSMSSVATSRSNSPACIPSSLRISESAAPTAVAVQKGMLSLSASISAALKTVALSGTLWSIASSSATLTLFRRDSARSHTVLPAKLAARAAGSIDVRRSSSASRRCCSPIW